MLIKSSIKHKETPCGVRNVSPNVFLIQEPISEFYWRKIHIILVENNPEENGNQSFLEEEENG